MTITTKTLNAAYCRLLRELVFNSRVENGSQQGTIHALHDVNLVIQDPRATVCSVPLRNMSRRYAAGEYLLYESGTDAVEDFAAYSKTWSKLAIAGKVNSAYGARIFGKHAELDGKSKWDYALSQLVKNADTKNAVIDIRQLSDIFAIQPDRCCTLYLQFTIVDNTMNLHVCMRSSDAWLGVPYDVFCFSRFLQKMLYQYNKATGNHVQLGTYTHQMLNVHLYEKHYKKVCAEIETLPPCNYEAAYRFPEYTENADVELPQLLTWEKNIYRKPDVTVEDKCAEIKAMKYHPYVETLASWLLNDIKMCNYTDSDKKYFARAEEISKGSSCVDRKVGCVVVDNTDIVVSSACNTVINCNKMCEDKHHRVCEVEHAEAKAVRLIKEQGIDRIDGGIAYVTLCPCLPCRKALNSIGITDIRVQGFSHKAAGELIQLYDPEFKN